MEYFLLVLLPYFYVFLCLQEYKENMYKTTKRYIIGGGLLIIVISLIALGYIRSTQIQTIPYRKPTVAVPPDQRGAVVPSGAASGQSLSPTPGQQATNVSPTQTITNNFAATPTPMQQSGQTTTLSTTPTP